MKSIIIFCDEIPYPVNNGIRIPLYDFIDSMTEMLKVTVIYIGGENGDSTKEVKNHLKTIGVDFYSIYNSSSRWLKLVYFFFSLTPQYVKRLDKRNRLDILSFLHSINPDFIYFDMPSLKEVILLSKPFGSKLIYAPNDSLALGFKNEVVLKTGIKKIKSFIEYKKARYLEEKIVTLCDSVFYVSPIDAKFVNDEYGLRGNRVQVVPLGVDTDKISPSIKEDYLLYVGVLDGGNIEYLLWFIRNVYSKVDDSLRWPLKVVGKCKQEIIIAELESIKGIEYLGYVENINDLYAKAYGVISPVKKSSGMINKVIEGLAAGAVVIGYDGSFSALSELVGNDNDIYISIQSDEAFVNSLESLFKNKEYYRQYQLNSRNFAVEKLSKRSAYYQYRKLVNG